MQIINKESPSGRDRSLLIVQSETLEEKDHGYKYLYVYKLSNRYVKSSHWIGYSKMLRSGCLSIHLFILLLISITNFLTISAVPAFTENKGSSFWNLIFPQTPYICLVCLISKLNSYINKIQSISCLTECSLQKRGKSHDWFFRVSNN